MSKQEAAKRDANPVQEPPAESLLLRKALTKLLGGSWDLVAAYNWAYSSNYNPPNWPYTGFHKPRYK